MRILVVDDSVVFRSQIKAALDGIDGITVVASAANGRIALERLEQHSIDVVVLDLEMPEMNGMEMLGEMKRRGFTQRVIVFAAPTGSGIELALSALRAGASDFIAKPEASGSLELALEGVKRDLVPKILQFAKSVRPRAVGSAPSEAHEKLTLAPRPGSARAASLGFPRVAFATFRPKVVAIGSSTGGPAALDHVLSRLKGKPLGVPILIVQHMPPKFTEFLAQRITEISGHPAREGRSGEAVAAGTIYVAPGDFHMTVERGADGAKPTLRLDQSQKRNSVRPAVDSLFESIVRVYGGSCAAFVLTGMGEDGLLGAKAIKEAAGGVMIQDKDSSIVWGMPGAVHAAGAYDAMGSLAECADALLKLI